MEGVTVLDHTGCTHWLEAVDSLRAHWHQRRPPHTFYTLGTAAYLDASVRSRQAYEDGRQLTSPLLREHFGPLLDQVAAAVAKVAGMPAQFDEERYALPGFHIYEAHPDFAASIGKVHCDRQYEGLDWSPYKVNPAQGRNISYTLALQLPTGGSGLNVWPVSHRKDTVDRESSKRSFTPEHRVFHAYSDGSIVIHSGDLVHQAVIQLDPNATGRRITLQGHGVDIGDRWLLYW